VFQPVHHLAEVLHLTRQGQTRQTRKKLTTAPAVLLLLMLTLQFTPRHLLPNLVKAIPLLLLLLLLLVVVTYRPPSVNRTTYGLQAALPALLANLLLLLHLLQK
jgi:hypothetical protein